MMDIRKLSIPLLLSTVLYTASLAQTIENVIAKAEGSKIIVTYDLISTDNNQKFDVEVFSSHNDFTTPALLVKGDVGKAIAPGKGKRVEWNARAELRNYQGEISVEIRGQVKKPMYSFISPKENGSLRKGKPTSILWQGGAANQRFKLELVQNDIVVQGLGTVPNTGMYNWTVPGDTRTGKGYQFRITAGDENIMSGEFTIKSKLPLALKLSPIPVVAIGGGVFYLWYKEKKRKDAFLATPPMAENNEITN